MKKELILPAHVKKEVDKKGTNVLPFSPIPAIAGGGDPPNDWLSDMPPGTVFLCHPKNKETVNLLEYHVIFQCPKSVHLLMRDAMQPTQDIYTYVNPKVFCQVWELYEVIVTGELPEGE